MLTIISGIIYLIMFLISCFLNYKIKKLYNYQFIIEDLFVLGLIFSNDLKYLIFILLLIAVIVPIINILLGYVELYVSYEDYKQAEKCFCKKIMDTLMGE